MSAYFSGYFNKGEINTPTIVHTAKQFKNLFGTATDENYNDWYQAYNYLQYSSNLIVTRIVGDATNAYAGYPSRVDVPITIYDQDDWEDKYTNLPILPDNTAKFIAKTPGSWGNSLKIAIITKLEWDANYVVYGNVTAKSMIKVMQPDEYAIFIIRNDVIVETFVKTSDTIEELNDESIYIYVKTNVGTPIGYHDGNIFMFDGNGLLADGNEFFDYNILIAFGASIISLDYGEETAPSEQDVIDAYELVDSKETYQFNYIISNEMNHQCAIALAESRRDCIAFIGAPNLSMEYICSYRNSLGNSTYATFVANYKYQLDLFKDEYRWINFAGDVVGLKAKADAEYSEWFSAAGLSNGRILNCVDVKYKPNIKQQDYWYKQSINSISLQDNYYVSGQRMMVERPISYDRVNLRALINKLERDIDRIARDSIFDVNDAYARHKIKVAINPYLLDIRAGRGLYNYKVICDETNNTEKIILENKLVIDIIIQPTVIAEFIRIRFTNTGKGAISEITSRSIAPTIHTIRAVPSTGTIQCSPLSTNIDDVILSENGDYLITETGDYLGI